MSGFILGVAILVAIVLYARNKNRKQKRLKEAYDDALRSGDKRKALEAGRAYYSFLRSGKLTMYDEQAINNDLIAMDSAAAQPA